MSMGRQRGEDGVRVTVLFVLYYSCTIDRRVGSEGGGVRQKRKDEERLRVWALWAEGFRV